MMVFFIEKSLIVLIYIISDNNSTNTSLQRSKKQEANIVWKYCIEETQTATRRQKSQINPYVRDSFPSLDFLTIPATSYKEIKLRWFRGTREEVSDSATEKSLKKTDGLFLSHFSPGE